MRELGVFGDTRPGDPAMERCAAAHSVDELEEKLNGLWRARARHGPIGTSPYLAMLLTPHGFVAPADGPIPVRPLVEARRRRAHLHERAALARRSVYEPNLGHIPAGLHRRSSRRWLDDAAPDEHVSETPGLRRLILKVLNSCEGKTMKIYSSATIKRAVPPEPSIMSNGRFLQSCCDRCDEVAAPTTPFTLLITRSTLRRCPPRCRRRRLL